MITLTLTKEEHDFIVAAVDAYVTELRQKLAPKSWSVTVNSKGFVATLDAPYGLKKDGTPKKQPGRKVGYRKGKK